MWSGCGVDVEMKSDEAQQSQHEHVLAKLLYQANGADDSRGACMF
jgi:hypothetical protein